MSRQAEAARLRERVAELESMLGECYVLSGADTDGDPPERRWEDAVRAVGKLRRDYDDCLDKLPDEPKRDEAGLREAATFVEALGPIIDLLDLDGFDGEAECLRDLRTALTAHPAPSEPEGDALRDALLELHDTVWKDECSATYCACQDEQGEPTCDFLGNAGEPFDIEALQVIELPAPEPSWVAMFAAAQGAKIGQDGESTKAVAQSRPVATRQRRVIELD